MMDYEIQPEEVKRMRDAGEEFTLLDCREPWEYQAAHIEGSTHIPMQEIPARVQELDPDDRVEGRVHDKQGPVERTGTLLDIVAADLFEEASPDHERAPGNGHFRLAPGLDL
jgi:hypothetical protein